jgi:hypothetical protein
MVSITGLYRAMAGTLCAAIFPMFSTKSKFELSFLRRNEKNFSIFEVQHSLLKSSENTFIKPLPRRLKRNLRDAKIL